MTLTTLGRDIYLRHTDTNGRAHVQQHRVWDVERFVLSQQKAAARLNVDAVKEDPKAKTLAHVAQITEDQYLTERKA